MSRAPLSGLALLARPQISLPILVDLISIILHPPTGCEPLLIEFFYELFERVRVLTIDSTLIATSLGPETQFSQGSNCRFELIRGQNSLNTHEHYRFRTSASWNFRILGLQVHSNGESIHQDRQHLSLIRTSTDEV
jgi:hypothetical protein